MENNAQIVVRRTRGGYRDRLRSYWLEVDGARVAKLAAGDEATITVTPGVHDVRAAIDWTGSRRVQVNTEAGTVTRFVVEPAGTAVQFWQAWQQDRYLVLTQE